MCASYGYYLEEASQIVNNTYKNANKMIFSINKIKNEKYRNFYAKEKYNIVDEKLELLNKFGSYDLVRLFIKFGNEVSVIQISSLRNKTLNFDKIGNIYNDIIKTGESDNFFDISDKEFVPSKKDIAWCAAYHFALGYLDNKKNRRIETLKDYIQISDRPMLNITINKYLELL